jgi:hypothetical protein
MLPLSTHLFSHWSIRENWRFIVLIYRAELVETHPTLKVQALEDMKVNICYRDT